MPKRLKRELDRERRVALAGVPRPEREADLPGADTASRQRRFDRLYFTGSLYRGYALVEAARSAETAPPRRDGIPSLLRFPQVVTFEKAEDLIHAIHGDRHRFQNQLAILDQETIDQGVATVAMRLRKLVPRASILLLTSMRDGHLSTAQIRNRRHVDRVGAWGGAVEDLAALIWLLQDQRSADEDLARGMPAILLVEDEPSLYGVFLPMIYRELLIRTRHLLPPDAPEERIRRFLDHRPRVLLAESFEDGLAILGRWYSQLIGVISDLQFPIAGEVHAEAGFKLAEVIRILRPTIPLMLQSEAERAPREVSRLPAFYLSKSSEDWLPNLRRIMLEYFGFGDFVFRDETGREICAASTIESLRDAIASVPLSSFLYHGRRNHISTWLYIHGAHELARRLRPIQGDSETVRRAVLRQIDRYLAAEQEREGRENGERVAAVSRDGVAEGS